MIKWLKKYAAILGLTLSCTLVTACNYNENESNVITEGQELTEKELKKINKRLDKIRVKYEYEDNYFLDRKQLNRFIDDSHEDIYCEAIIPSSDIDVLVKDIVAKIEENSKYIIENPVLDIDDYNIEDYDAPGFILEENGSFREFLYNSIYSMFLNNDKEDWNSLYCNLSDTAILFCDTLNVDGVTYKTRIQNNLDGSNGWQYMNLFYLNLNRMEILSKIACFNCDDYYDFYCGWVKTTSLHELEHCHQKHCNCWYQKNPSSFKENDEDSNNVLEHNFYSQFIRESSAVFSSEKYFPFRENLYEHNCGNYDDELEKAYMVEKALLLRSDYKKDDIFDNSVSVSNKKISEWFEVDKRKDYKELMNMMTVLNLTNLSFENVFEFIMDETYSDNNKKKLDAKKVLLMEDAVLELVIYSYENLIKFTEENSISKDAFYFLFDTYQRYYLNKAKLYDSEIFGYYFGDEFREKFNLATDIVYDYATMKYGNKEKIQKDGLDDLEKTLDNDSYYEVTRIINENKGANEYSSFDNTFPYMKELGPILGVEKYSAILNMAKEIENMPLLEYFNATDYSLDSYIESLENNNVMKKSIN